MMRIPDEACIPATETAGRDNPALAVFLRNKRSQMAHTALVEAQNAYTVLMDQWVEAMRAERSGNKAAGLAKDCVERHTRTVDETLAESAMDAAAKEAFRTWAHGRGRAVCLRMAAFEDAQRREYALEQHEIRRGGIFRAAAAEPQWYADHTAQLEETHVLAVGQGIFTSTEAQHRLALDRLALKDIVFESLYASDPGKAMAAMDTLGFDAARQKRERCRFDGDARAGELLAEAARRDRARVLAGEVEEAERAAALTGEGKGLRMLALRLADAGEHVAAEELVRHAERYESNAVLIKESAAMDLPVLADCLRKLEKAVYAAESTALKEVLEMELGLRTAVYRHREAALAHDPAEAVADEAQGETEEETASYRLAAQERNGVPEAARRVLTHAERRDLVALAAKLAEAEEDIRAAAYREFRERLGRHAERVIGEVLEAMEEEKTV